MSVEKLTAAVQCIKDNPIRSSGAVAVLGVAAIALGVLAEIGGVGHVSSALNWTAVALGSVMTVGGVAGATYFRFYPANSSSSQTGTQNDTNSRGDSAAASLAGDAGGDDVRGSAATASAAAPSSSVVSKTLTLPNDCTYRGQTLNGKPHGKGTLTNKYKDTFTGTWEEGNPIGEFSVEYIDEYTYVGEVNNVLEPNGKGTLTNKNKETFTGTWDKDEPVGKFTVKYTNGETYLGEINNDLEPNGKGIWTCPDGDKYVGEYKDGKFHGHGKYEFSDGRVYEGDFKDGEPHGFGEIIDKNGNTIKEGRWEKSRLVETIKVEFFDAQEDEEDQFYDAQQSV